jgi:pyruvate/2-oxoglutarate dehydrogenase complex dihydrolipoamide acyltransferase (E2) component
VSSADGGAPGEHLLEIVMPQLGITIAEGTVVAWHKQPGEEVDADEAIGEISSDKVDSDIPAPAAGRIVELVVAVGTTVDVGTVIATMAVEGEADVVPATPAAGAGVADRAGDPAAAGRGSAARHPAERGGGGREHHSPVVVRLAAELGVALESVAGTGHDGRVRREDVLAAAGRPATADPSALYVPPAAGQLSRMRRSIGEHMKRSLSTAATVTSWIEVDFSAVEARRRELGTTALPIVAAATVQTLAEFGELNAWLDGEAHTLHSEVNLGVAVSLGAGGLIVPVVRGAQALDVQTLAAAIADLAARARSGELSPDDVRDGTFTITNPGQFGTFMATPVINQPQVAILDVEAIVRRPVAVTTDGVETVEVRPICILGLSWDHRALDGVYAAHFLAALRARLVAV